MLSYTQAFASFLFRTPGIKADKIKSIFVFGSVARGDFDKESDVDIFIHTEKANEKEITKHAKIALAKFYRSDEYEKFRILGIINPISIKCGDARKWQLFNSIKHEGIVIYSSSISPFFSKHFLVEVKPISDIAKRNKIIRKLAGRKEKGRKERGAIELMGGSVLDSRHYIIPAERLTEITKIFSKEKVFYELREVWM